MGIDMKTVINIQEGHEKEMAEKLRSKRYEPPLINLTNKNNSWTLTAELTGSNNLILEVGTSTGYLTKILRDMGNHVIGVEIDEEAASIAEEYCDLMITGDVEAIDLDEYLGPSSIDVAILGDVLEHLKSPADMLEKVREYLKPDGCIVVSIPNVCHGDVLLSLLKGDFRYTPVGLLDQTHLRFFGFKNVVDLLTDGDYSITDVHTTRIPVGSTELGRDLGEVPRELFKFIEALPNSDVYQFVLRAKPSKNPMNEPVPEADLKEIFNRTVEDLLNEHETHKKREIAEICAEHKEALELIRALNRDVSERDGKINEMDRELQKAQGRINELNQTAFERDGRIYEIDGELQKAQGRIKELNLTASERDGRIYEMDRELQKAQGRINELNQTVSERDGRIYEIDGELQKAQGRIKELNLTASERDGRIYEMDRELQKAQGRINELNQTAFERDGRIYEMDRELQKAQERINELNLTASERDGRIYELKNLLRQSESQAQRLEKEISEMRRSMLWQLLMRYHSGFVERGMPLGTRRRRYYDLGLEGGRILMNEGIRSFSFRIKGKLSSKIPFLKDDLNVPLFETNKLNTSSCIPLSLEEGLSGEFAFPAEGINDIRIFTATYRRTNADLTLNLKISPDGPVIRKAKVKGHAIKDNDYTSFKFKPIKKIPNGTVLFDLKSNGEPHAAVWFDPKAKYCDLRLYRSEKLIDGEIYLQAFSSSNLKDRYHLWRLKNEPSHKELDKLRKAALSLKYKPKISIITPVWNTDERWLRLAIESASSQIYENWELCIADGRSEKPHVKKVIEEYAKADPRIKVKFLSENRGIAGNSNEALSLATGEFVAFLDHDDEFAPFALYEVVKLLNENPELDYIYSDEDKIDETGKRLDPFFKPDWSPDMFLSCNYLCHLSVIRKSVVDDVGGFRRGYDGSQDYDLFLRVIEQIDNDRIAHISKILYHWRIIPESAASSCQAKPYAYIAGKKALKDAMERRGIDIDGVFSGLADGVYRVKYKISDENPKVTIVIPTKDKVEVLKTCVNSIINNTEYHNYEIIIVDNRSEEEVTHKYYADLEKNVKIKILNYEHPFNYSSINNYAVSKANSEYILFLNNDIEVMSSEWLSAMLEHIQRDGVGAVGAKLLYPNDTIQHAGVVTGIIGNPPIAGHAHRHFPRCHPGYFTRIQIIQNSGAVTAACMMTRKSIFEKVGGLDEKNLAVAFNDIDYCLELRKNGYLIVYTPYAEMYHHESLSRGHEDTPEKQQRFLREVAFMREKWGDLLDNDPYYNPNLSRDKEDFSISTYKLYG